MRNYKKELDLFLQGLTYKPTLLLHACCAPCSSYVVKYLAAYFNLTVYFYNPCIEPLEEYNKRLYELHRLSSNSYYIPFTIIEGAYDNAQFEAFAKDLADAPEGGERCKKCYYMRLLSTAKLAKSGNFEYFSTTLTVSPHKPCQTINEIGQAISEDIGIPFIAADFKKADGYKQSVALSKEFGIYRQEYCGCLKKTE